MDLDQRTLAAADAATMPRSVAGNRLQIEVALDLAMARERVDFAGEVGGEREPNVPVSRSDRHGRPTSREWRGEGEHPHVHISVPGRGGDGATSRIDGNASVA